MSSERIGAPVRTLQTMLRTIARAEPAVPSVVPDGVFGADTERAVRCVQRMCGLPESGEADRETWRAVCRMYDALSPMVLPAPVLQLRWEPMQVILPGARNSHLYLIQAMLTALADYYSNVPPVRVTGVHDGGSAEAVRWLQRMGALEASGTVDQRTWGLLCDLYRMTVCDGCHGEPYDRRQTAQPDVRPGPEP